jgi:hypothetical protein
MGELDIFMDEKLGAANQRAHRAELLAAKAQVVVMEIEAWLARPKAARLTEEELSIWLRRHWPVH